jgi:hypothetical protein
MLGAAARLFLENVVISRSGDCNLTTSPGITSYLVAINCTFTDAKKDAVCMLGRTRSLFRRCIFSRSKRYGANASRSGQSVSFPVSLIDCHFEKCSTGIFVGEGACVYTLRTQVISCATGLNFNSNSNFSVSSCVVSSAAMVGINFEKHSCGTIGDVLVHSSATFGCFLDNCPNVRIVRMSFENCPVGVFVKKNGRGIVRSLLLRKCATGNACKCHSRPNYITDSTQVSNCRTSRTSK